MNEPNDPDQLSSWHALQVELGLVSTNEPPATPKFQAKPSSLPPSISEEIPSAVAPPLARLAPPAEEMPEVIEEVPAFDDVPAAAIPAETAEGPVDHPVEVGEAPEEVESEPPPEEEKRRGRRRGRRRRGRKQAGEAPADGQAIDTVEQGEAGGFAGAGEAGSRDLADGDDNAEGTDSTPLAEDEEDEEEVEPMSFADFNVPTWQELIASLYRPER